MLAFEGINVWIKPQVPSIFLNIRCIGWGVGLSYSLSAEFRSQINKKKLKGSIRYTKFIAIWISPKQSHSFKYEFLVNVKFVS